jgi:HEXXH motif-containing protein
VSASDILWTDIGLYQKRYEKSASALIAIRRALEHRRPLGGGESEFLELVDRVAAVDPGAFTRVWSDPSAYFWVRLAYEFVGNSLTPGPLSPLAAASATVRGTAGDSRATLAVHLGDFKRFVLALGVVSDQDRMFDESLETVLPFVIPATHFVVSGKGKIAVHGFSNGCLEVTWHGERRRLALNGAPHPESPCLRKSPIAVVEDYQLPLQPEMFNLPGLEVGRPLLDVAPEFESAQLQLTEEALTLIRRHAPLAFGHFQEIIRSVALKPPGVGNYTNISHSDLPGSFVCTVVRDPHWLADAFIHELYHNRLFFIEEIDSFFTQAEDNLMTRNHYYSPWRDDLRPLHGIFHGLYVYLALWRFWLEVYRSGQSSGSHLTAAALAQILRTSLQLDIAASQLQRFGEFTSFGASLFGAMAQEVSFIRSATRELRLPHDLPAMTCSDEGIFSPQRGLADGKELTVREAVLKHAQKYDSARQCLEIESIVSLSP